MSYIVPSELPKSCSKCPYGYVIMQNPLSSKTPIKRYRCQVGKPPWRTFDVDLYNEEYKHKDCPLVPMEEIMERLEREKVNKIFAGRSNGKTLKTGINYGIATAIDILKKVGGLE